MRLQVPGFCLALLQHIFHPLSSLQKQLSVCAHWFINILDEPTIFPHSLTRASSFRIAAKDSILHFIIFVLHQISLFPLNLWPHLSFKPQSFMIHCLGVKTMKNGRTNDDVRVINRFYGREKNIQVNSRCIKETFSQFCREIDFPGQE